MAFEEARTAAELAAKSMLARAGLAFKKEHNVAGDLRQHRLLPNSVGAAALSELLGDFSRGVYGFDQPIERAEAKNAIRLAGILVEAARAPPP